MAEGPAEPRPSAGRGTPTEVPKPYTVPEGYVAPKMSELWLYANKTHPYYRYGTSHQRLLKLHCDVKRCTCTHIDINNRRLHSGERAPAKAGYATAYVTAIAWSIAERYQYDAHFDDVTFRGNFADHHGSCSYR
ncbi:hypothetical protein WJX77_009125 [Trebouxia sp. C0004]